jgi:protein TonB
MIDPPRILDQDGAGDPRAGLKRALVGAARREASPADAKRALLGAFGLDDAGVSAGEIASGVRRARASEWQPVPLFSSVLRQGRVSPERAWAGAAVCAAVLAAVFLGAAHPPEHAVEEPTAMVELRTPFPKSPGPSPKGAEHAPAGVPVIEAPEVPVGPRGSGGGSARNVAGAAPIVEAPAAPTPPVASVPVASAPPSAPPEVAGNAAVEAGSAPPQPSSEVLPFGEGMSPPRLIEGPEPVYTREAREAKVQGTMLVRCVITTAGSLSQCRVIKPLPLLEQPVLEALARRRYTPVTFQGRPVNVAYVIPFRFELP